ncbi:hypothetical protein [Zooshikella ganghwensis]|uniref:Transglycosylase SLT domain-containing protein n=1 Tax=Zooshikella ganghwensis TaxID=202772 RepID=A0A4P9VIE3_9GAMM|nr:hypothetical protein [Zooshikella ganghwensis]RDH41412.1 hypothetical protein B9G39_28560 [Zooshikella ganghwensis]
MKGYGLTSPNQALEIATKVYEVLGNGSGYAVDLLLETAAQETKLGNYPDRTPTGAGVGLCQIDPILFKDIQNRARSADRDRLKESFNVDLSKLPHRDLAYSPLLSFIFCRLHYKLRPGAIPETLEGRANYWKKHYNTVAGKGRPEEYVRSAELVRGLIG